MTIFPNSLEFTTTPQEKHKTVAIIMRTRDRPALVTRGFQSVLKQNFTDWHLFIVNDGGVPTVLTEKLRSVEASFAGRLSIIHNSVVLGRSGAGNVILGMLAGKIPQGADKNLVAAVQQCAYCVIHDDDDSWHPDFLSETVAFLEREENRRFGGVSTRAILVKEKINDENIQPLEEQPFWPHVKYIDFWEMLKENRVLPVSFLFRTKLLVNTGILNPEMSVLEDWDLCLRILLIADIAFMDKPLARYHHRKNLMDGPNGNSVIAEEKNHKELRCLYDSAIYRAASQNNPDTFAILYALANTEARIKKETDKILEKLGENEKILKKKSLLKQVDSFLYQNFFKYFLRFFEREKAKK